MSARPVSSRGRIDGTGQRRGGCGGSPRAMARPTACSAICSPRTP
jgi:hypothetical protein